MNAPTTTSRGWRDQAACRTVDPELHFPEGTTGRALLQAEHAKAVCRRCPVMDTCRQWALDQRVPYGVFGGMTEDERRTELRRRQPSRIAKAQPAPQPAWSPVGKSAWARGQHLASVHGVQVLETVVAA